jgi:hypothetical protein
MKVFIKRINDILKWEPHNLFHYTSYTFWDGGSYTNYHYTAVGEFFNNLPILLGMLLKICYYVLTWPVYCLVKWPWCLFIGLCIPQRWLD